MKTVVELTREAGIRDCTCNGTLGCLDRFAELIRADEREKWMERTAILIRGEREACHALRQTLPNPHGHCQVSAHAYDMAIAAYGAAIRARGNT